MIQHLIFTSSEQIGYIGRDDDTEDYTNLAPKALCGTTVKYELDATKVKYGFKVMTHFLPRNFGQDSIDCPQCAEKMIEMSRFASVFPENLSSRAVVESGRDVTITTDLAVR